MRNKANSPHSRHHGTDTDGSVCHTELAPYPSVSSSISTNASKGLKASADDLLINRQADTEVEAPGDLDERLRNLKSWCRAKSIKQNKEKFQPVTFARKALTSAERKYSQSGIAGTTLWNGTQPQICVWPKSHPMYWLQALSRHFSEAFDTSNQDTAACVATTLTVRLWDPLKARRGDVTSWPKEKCYWNLTCQTQPPQETK